MINKRFQLFQCCIPVKGINRGIIIDFQRKSFHIVPNEIIDIIDQYKNEKALVLLNDFQENKLILKKYIKYFLENELIILTNEIENYPPISKDFLKPFIIDTISIEVNKLNSFMIDFFDNQIDELGLICIKLILRDSVIDNLIKILNLLENSKIQLVTLFVDQSNDLGIDIEIVIGKIKAKYPRLVEVVFCNYSGKDNEFDAKKDFYYEVLSVESVLFKKIHSVDDFIINIDAYNESLGFNLIYNRTVHIDYLGNVRHAINHKMVYGNISTNKLKNIIKDEKLKIFWEITKDKIETCKDCEFRYICPDGRVPNESSNRNILYTNKLKCNYDPYQNKWKS